ncbi:MAG TPA: YXWGXW repeat-containing protein [Polyangia bacterium]
MNITRSIALSLSLFSFGCATVGATTSQTSPAQQQLVVEVPTGPPDPKQEVKTPCPGPGQIWVAGYWDYIGGHHVWRDGRWMQGMSGYEYVRARYEFDGKAWQFHVPHWHKRAASAAAVTSPTQVAQRQ